MLTYVLILFIATGTPVSSGAASITQEFTSEKSCLSAGKALVDSATQRHNYVLTWGCFPK